MINPSTLPIICSFLLIDTDQYAGNFYRQLCAYATGVVGECGVGREQAEMFNKSFPDYHDDHVLMVADDHGCERPAMVFKNHHYWEDQLGIAWRNTTPVNDPKVLSAFRDRVALLHEPQNKKYQCLMKEGPTYTKTYSCTTVAIVLDAEEPPPTDVIDIWVPRIKAFCSEPQKYGNKWLPEKIEVDSIRIVEYEIMAHPRTWKGLYER